MATSSAVSMSRLFSPSMIASSRMFNLRALPYILRALPSLSIAVPGVSLNLPGLLGDIWESVLRAVPKKKMSHSKSRSRRLAGKALEDVNSLCRCPGCGGMKRSHRLCQHCLEEMKDIWRKDYPKAPELGSGGQ